MKLFLQLIVVCFFVSGVQAQRVCGTPQYARTAHTGYVARGGTVSNTYSRDTTPNEIITIPVVIHLLFNTAAQNLSDEQILSQIIALNNDYRRMNDDASNTPDVFKPFAADTKIMFCLAQVDPTGRATRGIIRKHTDQPYFLGDDGMKYTAAGGDDAWDCKKYLNIWVCNMFGRALGYATAPGGPADKDGVVINFDVFGTVGNLRGDFDKGRTATHEVGHWLGLRHLWGDESCGDDGIDDTPRQLNYNFNCPSFPHVTTCSVNGNGDMFMDYMDLTNDACMNMFTTGQKKEMRSLFALNGSRNTFLNSYACDSSLASGAPLPDDTLPIVKPAGDVRPYPNPVKDIVTLMPLNEYVLTGKICTVFNMSGMKILQQTLNSERPTVDLSKLQAGVYILKIGQGGDRKIVKIIKI
ncbi:MAG: M43 family zinc metalloprotease [Ferruginibacter sp.]